MIQIGKHQVGDNCKPFIVAEIGSNWKTLEDCLYSIRRAKWAKADAVKFQLFDYESLYGFKQEPFPDLGPGGYVDYIELKPLPGSLPKEWIPKLAEHCRDQEIEFMCSSFSPSLAEVVDPFVGAHKVASSELLHKRLLEKINSFKKPVFLSTAASIYSEIEQALQCLRNCPVILFYCVGSYPANNVDLRIIQELKKASGKLIGYSDHTTDIRIIPAQAKQIGACVIEKHMTAIDSLITPDTGHSISASEFKLMVDSIMCTEGEPYIGPNMPSEVDMILKHRRRLKVIEPIKKGDRFIEDKNFGAFRSLEDDIRALSPFAIDQVSGRLAKRSMAVGEGVGPGDFE